MSQSIYIEEYSTKSFVVRGETRDYKESLKALGGKWNSRLTDKETGDKFGAWLFWSDKRIDIDDWFNKGCQEMENTQTSNSGSGVGKELPVLSSSSSNITALTIRRMEAKIDRLSKMLEAICSLHDIIIEPVVEETEKSDSRLISRTPVRERMMNKTASTSTSKFVKKLDFDIDEYEDELPVKTSKRLLGRTKH